MGHASGNRARRHDPLRGLAGDVCNEVKVMVVVEDDKPGGFCSSRDEQVGDLHPTLLTPGRQGILDFNRTIKHRLIYCYEWPRRSKPAHGKMSRRTD